MGTIGNIGMKKLFGTIIILAFIVGAFYVGQQYERFVHPVANDDGQIVVDVPTVPPVETGHAPSLQPDDTDTPTESGQKPILQLPTPIIHTVKPGDHVILPLEIFGQAPGAWFDGNQVRVQVVDANESLVGEGLVRTRSSVWKEEDLVTFSGLVEELVFPQTDYGHLIVRSAHVDDSSEPYRIPVRFINETPDTIRVTSPLPNQLITSPLTLQGEAAGWYFEGDFSVRLFDDGGNLIAENFVSAQDDWFSPEFVPFAGTLEFTPDESGIGTLVFQKANPSGLPEHNEQLRVPVSF